jgi:predicted nuclease of restriction endonuclease-like (RecB) superfamily
MTSDLVRDDREYSAFVADLTTLIQQSRLDAAIAVNQRLVMLYWRIGREILRRQVERGWGSKVVDQLADDLRRRVPDMKGLSSRNLRYMRAFADAHPDEEAVLGVFSKLPWGHNVRLLDALDESDERLWYAQQAIAHGWSRNMLLEHIDQSLYNRQSNALTNFERTLPQPQSDLAQSLLKDSYQLDFLSLGPEVQEQDFKQALGDRIRDFLLELGVGFAFVGSQHHLEVGGEDFYVDLLFYHLKLRCFVVIDLKMGDFRPEYSGTMNFYVSAVDDILRHAQDQPTIGIILCKTQNKTIVEYALRDVTKPIGVSLYRTGTTLPADIKGELPSVEELEAQINTALP